MSCFLTVCCVMWVLWEFRGVWGVLVSVSGVLVCEEEIGRSGNFLELPIFPSKFRLVFRKELLVLCVCGCV